MRGLLTVLANHKIDNNKTNYYSLQYTVLKVIYQKYRHRLSEDHNAVDNELNIALSPRRKENY